MHTLRATIRTISFSERIRWPYLKQKYTHTCTRIAYDKQNKYNILATCSEMPIYCYEPPNITDIYGRVSRDIINRIHLINSHNINYLSTFSTYGIEIEDLCKDSNVIVEIEKQCNHSNQIIEKNIYYNNLCGITQQLPTSTYGNLITKTTY